MNKMAVVVQCSNRARAAFGASVCLCFLGVSARPGAVWALCSVSGGASRRGFLRRRYAPPPGGGASGGGFRESEADARALRRAPIMSTAG